MIRNATIDDAEAIATIHVQTWRAAYVDIFPAEFLASLSITRRAAVWQQLLTANKNATFVAEVDGCITGWATGGTSRDTDANGASEVHAIYVLPDYWHKEIGAQLMQALEEALPRSPDTTLWVLRDNHRAIRFYEKLGYVADGAQTELERGGVIREEIRFRKNMRPGTLPMI